MEDSLFLKHSSIAADMPASLNNGKVKRLICFVASTDGEPSIFNNEGLMNLILPSLSAKIYRFIDNY